MSYFIKISQKLGLPVSTAGVCYGLAHEFNYYRLTNLSRFKTWTAMHRFITKLDSDPRIIEYLQTPAAVTEKERLLRDYEAETIQTLAATPADKRDEYSQQRLAAKTRDVQQELIAKKVVDDIHQVHQHRLDLAARYEQEFPIAQDTVDTIGSVAKQQLLQRSQHKTQYIDDNLDAEEKKLLTVEVFLQGVHFTMSGTREHNEIFLKGTPKYQNRELIQKLFQPTQKQRCNDDFRILLRNLKLAKEDESRSASLSGLLQELAKYLDSPDEKYQQKLMRLDLEQTDHILEGKSVLQWLTDNQKLLPEITRFSQKLQAIHAEHHASVKAANLKMLSDQAIVKNLCSQLRIDNKQSFTEFLNYLEGEDAARFMSFSLEFSNHEVSFCRLKPGIWLVTNHDVLRPARSSDVFDILCCRQLDQSGNSLFVFSAYCRLDLMSRCDVVRRKVEKYRFLIHNAAGNGAMDVNYHGLNDVTPLYLASQQLKRGKSYFVVDLIKAGADKDEICKKGWPILLLSVHYGDLDTVRFLIDAGMDKETKNENGFTALMLAATLGEVDIIQLLLDSGANIAAKNDQGWTALMLATRHGQLAACRLLLAAGADKDVADVSGWTALMIAIEFDQAAIFSELLQYGVDVEAKMDGDWNALMLAVYCGRLSMLSELLKYGVDVDAENDRGWTALMIAIEHGRFDVCSELLQYGADKNKKDRRERTTLLLAAEYGNVDIARLLLQLGADKEAVDKYGDSPFLVAVSSGHVNMVAMLLDEDVNTEVTDMYGNSALINAVGSKPSITSLLINAGVNKDAKGEDGRTALMAAAELGESEIVRLLIAAGADKDLQDDSGCTALMLAAFEDKVDIVRLLIAAGADKDIQDDLGNTALMLAAEEGEVDMVRLLIAAGADKTIKNKQGSTAVDLAAENDEMMILLTPVVEQTNTANLALTLKRKRTAGLQEQVEEEIARSIDRAVNLVGDKSADQSPPVQADQNPQDRV